MATVKIADRLKTHVENKMIHVPQFTNLVLEFIQTDEFLDLYQMNDNCFIHEIYTGKIKNK